MQVVFCPKYDTIRYEILQKTFFEIYENELKKLKITDWKNYAKTLDLLIHPPKYRTYILHQLLSYIQQTHRFDRFLDHPNNRNKSKKIPKNKQ